MEKIKSCAFVFERGGNFQAALMIEEGIIDNIALTPVSFDNLLVCKFNDCVLFPGFVDVHVHLREPGFLYKEDIKSGTLSAAAGGFTAICAMPNVKPAPDSLSTLALQQYAIQQKASVRVLPYGTITKERAGRELSDIAALAPFVCAFSDDGSGVQDAALMKEAMLAIKAQGKMLVAHCEDNNLLHGGVIHDGGYAKANNLPGICSESEWKPIERDLELVRGTGCSYHVCHISCKESVALIRHAKAEGLPVTCETAPHYLLLDENDLQDLGCFKMNPPLRSAEDKAALIEGIKDGTIDMIATDHAPHSAAEKAQGLSGSAMGIVGLETAFPLLYTELVRKNIISLEKLLELMSEAPRRIFGISGGISVGNIADFTIFDLNEKYEIKPDNFMTKGRSTPFAGKTVFGKCKMTVADGKIAWSGKLAEEE